MRHYAQVGSRRLRTANYSPEARMRLGDAVAKAREAAGHKYRTTFARAANVNMRSLEMLEAGDAGVGQSVLFAVARALPEWTEDTPRLILEDITPAPEPRIASTRSAAEIVATGDPEQILELVIHALKLVPHVRRTRGDDVANAWIRRLLAIAQDTNADLRDEIRHQQ